MRFSNVIARLHELKPDIVVVTGDIVDGQGDDFDALAQRFQTYAPPLGAYAVIGNHEHYIGLDHSLRFMRNAGFTALRGESAVVVGSIRQASMITVPGRQTIQSG